MYYTVEQMDYASRWNIIKECVTLGEAETQFRYLHSFCTSSAWRVTKRHPNGAIAKVCSGIGGC